MAATGESTATTRLPRFWEFEAAANWQRIDFISDLHLSEDRPRTVAAFAAHLRSTPADAVFLLGDVFDLWIGDDALDRPFEAACVDAIAEAASQRTIGIMVGNRDFLLGGRMLKACGAMALADPTVLVAFGRRFLLSHGDALCLGDTDYQRFRAEVRGASWQRDFLALPIMERLRRAQAIRQQSELRKRSHDPDDWIDIDPASAVQWMHEAGAAVLIHGHTHCPGSEPMAPGFVRHVLTDWELDDADRSPRAEVLQLSANGIDRRPPAGF